MRILLLACALCLAMPTTAQTAHLGDFQVVELRSYTIKEGQRDDFARYFESYFPEAFQQLGAIIFGQFTERGKPQSFTWLRGFRNTDARATVNATFYYGPLWKEHSIKMNPRLVDHTNVLALRPLVPSRGVAVSPAVDTVLDPAAQGIVALRIFAVRPEQAEALSKRAAAGFERYLTAGMRESGLLVTLEGNNNFPQLPVRTDGHYLVWIGIARDDDMLARFTAIAKAHDEELAQSSLLAGAPETLVLQPTPRSRLRWSDS